MKSIRLVVLGLALCTTALGDIPNGWHVTLQRPFEDISVRASSEQADQWPASKAIDGDTSEPEGIWQTLRDNPEAAWLELTLAAPRRLRGVRIYHQENAGYYRSVDYTISCWADGAWMKVAEVAGNKDSGWREHPFEPVLTAKVRIDITQSEHGNRMGLNEVELVEVRDESAKGAPRERLTEPYCCGKTSGMGMIAFEAAVPEGASVALSTRTAPDEGGKPGEWSDWSEPYGESPAALSSPLGEWIQCRAVFRDEGGQAARVETVDLGWPSCVDMIDPGALIPAPGSPLALSVHFNQPMDTASKVSCLLEVGGKMVAETAGGQWDAAGRVWHCAALALGPEPGVGRITVGGAHTAAGKPMLAESEMMVAGDEPLLARLRGMADWMMENPNEAIFVEGYNERTILGLYAITGEKRYLDHVRKWAQWLLEYQRPEGYWPTGYGDVYFADTGSALGLLINFYKYATEDERKAIDRALQRYVDLLLVRGDSQGRPFVHDDGSLGVGYHADKEGNVKSDLNKPYTIATALTGAEIFGALYYMQGDERYKEISVKACDWLLDTMVESGQIPYIIEDWNPEGKDPFWVWGRWPYDTAAYAGEGFLAAWTYVDDEAFRRRLGERAKPHIDWVVRTQNGDGSWAKKGSGDQLRSHGVVNMLLWYNAHVQSGPRITAAIRKWYLLVLDEERCAYLKVPGDGIATSLAGRALLEIIEPDMDCFRWKDEMRPARR